jgi:hypothetical protein
VVLLPLLLLAACAPVRPLYHFLLACPAAGPVVETDLALYLEPVSLDAYYEELTAFAASFPMREVGRADRDGQPAPIYHFGPLGTVGGRRLLVVAAVHGNEISGSLAAPRLLRELRQDAESYEGVELHLIAPANPVGLHHLSRYDAAGCDVNRDFGRFRTPEAAAIRDVMAQVAPELVVAWHEGPQNGFYVIATRRVPARMADAIAQAVAAARIPLTTRSYFGLPLGTPGATHEGRWLTAVKALAAMGTLGTYAERHGVGVLTTETPFRSTDLDARVTAQLVALRAAARELRNSAVPVARELRQVTVPAVGESRASAAPAVPEPGDAVPAVPEPGDAATAAR